MKCTRCGAPANSGRVVNGKTIYACGGCMKSLVAAIEKGKKK